jgi:histone acetyltransferase (RNA polymerase elongator complex component)
MNRGCPHRCLFCNERLTAGDLPESITEAAFVKTVLSYLGGAGRRHSPAQIAFYGGTFTGMEQKDQRRLLGLAAPFLREGLIDSIRLSTRPDEIGSEELDLLTAFGVTTIEVGAQSLDDEILLRARRATRLPTPARRWILPGAGFKTGFTSWPCRGQAGPFSTNH